MADIKIEEFINYSEEQRKAVLALVEEEHTWECCCSSNNGRRSSDKRLIKFVVVHSVIISVIVFSGTMLGLSDTCEDSQAFSGLLTFCLGLIINISEKK